MKKEKKAAGEDDDLDALVNAGNSNIKQEKPAKKTKKAAGDGMKQTKINFPKASKKKVRIIYFFAEKITRKKSSFFW